jgi:hypothetical protein
MNKISTTVDGCDGQERNICRGGKVDTSRLWTVSRQKFLYKNWVSSKRLVKQRGQPLDKDSQKPNSTQDICARADDARMLGLAFSGGGIRSATFNLGILQALSKLGLLGHIDYLSTVSGGGYIGSWMTAWVNRRMGLDFSDCVRTGYSCLLAK